MRKYKIKFLMVHSNKEWDLVCKKYKDWKLLGGINLKVKCLLCFEKVVR